jgi:hypothetical protein
MLKFGSGDCLFRRKVWVILALYPVDVFLRGQSINKSGFIGTSVYSAHRFFYTSMRYYSAAVCDNKFSFPLLALDQPFSIFLPWRNPWNNFQVSGNPCIKITRIISTAHGTLAWSVSCRYNNPIIIVNALLSREWYFSVNLFILANKLKKRC